MIPHAQLRAGALALLVAFNLLAAIPLAERVTDASLKRPADREEFAQWASLAGAVGISAPTFRAQVITTSNALADLQAVSSLPARRLLRRGLFGQAWELFAAPDDNPQRLQIVGLGPNGERRVLYRRLDPLHTWRAEVLGYRRIRGVYDKQRPTPAYRQLADHLAHAALTEFPDLHAVEIMAIRRHTGAPGEAVSSKTTQALRRVIDRDSVVTP